MTEFLDGCRCPCTRHGSYARGTLVEDPNGGTYSDYDILAVVNDERLTDAPECFAISPGLSALFTDDHEVVRHGLVRYDALYAWCRSRQGETHSWPPKMAAWKWGGEQGWRKPMTRVALATLALATAVPLQAQTTPADWRPVDEALGRAGTTQPDGVRRYAFPRSDLKVQLDGVAVKPALALGSWLAFQPMGKEATVMGDLVLTQEEVNPVMSALLGGGLTITALHNHLMHSTPATMYMHVEGHGDPAKLAASLRSALGRTPTPMTPPANTADPKLDLDTAALDKIMGAQGKPNGGVYQFSFPRAENVVDGNMPAPASMGTATAIGFQPTGSGKAAITGDLVLTAREVDPVLRALRAGGIEVTALHNHMLDDQPRLFFMHFWANDDAQKLARSLRAAVDSIAVKRTAAMISVPGASSRTASVEP